MSTIAGTASAAAQRDQPGAWATLRRGLALSPEFVAGLPGTLALALVATVGRVLVPIAVQQTIDKGLIGAGRPGHRPRAARPSCSPPRRLLVTAVAAYLLNVRLFRTTESGLATLRVRAFRHVHDLSVLTQNAERRGSLVSRVTSDVDTISTFMQWGGLLMVVSVGQLVVATVLMAIYSWQLTLLVWVVLPAALPAAAHLPEAGLAAPTARSASGWATCSARCRSPWSGASTVRAYGIEERTGAPDRRRDRARTARRRREPRPWSR